MSRKGIVRVLTITLPLLLALLLITVSCSKPAPSPTPSAKPVAPATSAAAAPTTSAAKPAAAPASPIASPKVSPAAAPADLPRGFAFVASGAGVSYTMSTFFSEMVTKYTPMKGSLERATGTEQSIVMVTGGQALACTYSTPAPRIICNNRKLLINVMFSAAGTESAANIGMFSKVRNDFKTFKDLKGKRVYAEKPENMWGEPIMMALLKANNMTRDDIKWLQFTSAEGDAFRDVKEGRVDAILYLAGAATMEMSESTGLYVFPFSPAEQQAIVDTGLGFEARVLPKGLYGCTVDTPIVGAPNVMFVYPGASESAVYTVVKMVYEHVKEVQGSQAAAKGYTLENALTQSVFPYHPGSIKYFKEAGIWKAANDDKQAKAVADWKKITGK